MLVALGLTALRLALGDAMLRFVQPRMRIPLIVAAALLLFLGGATIVRAWRPTVGRDRDGAGSGPDHAAPGVGWLLIVPVAVLLLVSPAPLGADAAARSAVRTTKLPQAQNVTFDPLPLAVNGAVPLSLTAYSERALYDSTESLAGTTVRLIGFVVNSKDKPGEVYLTRFRIACCAADAFPVEVVLRGNVGKRKQDTWLEVTGTWRATVTSPDSDEFLRAELDVKSVDVVGAPGDPYE